MQYGGRLWIIRDEAGKLVDDIDTDMIFHNAHLAETDKAKMGQFAFGNLKGYQDFAKRAQKGDIVLVGANFGSGSSRAQAVDCFASLGVSCILAASYGAIYKRNAINSALPIFEYEGVSDLSGIENLAEAEVVPVEGIVKAGERTLMHLAKPPQVQLDILRAGGLFEYARTL